MCSDFQTPGRVLGRIERFAGTHGIFTPAGVLDGWILIYPDKPVGWPWIAFPFSGAIFRG